MTITLLSCVRDGLAAQLPAGAALDAAGRVGLGVAATVGGTEAPQVDVKLFGPGDVAGLDPRQVIRMDPPAGAQGTEPNLFAQVEFDRPDLPWLFSPGAPDAQGRLQPWIALVVVEQRDGITLTQRAGQELPVLQVDDVAELPDPADTWAWAHAQIAGNATTAADVTSAVRGAPGLTLSRLLCPRLLRPNARYHACVVPTYEAGRRAGLGLEATGGAAPAWAAGGPPPALPVYHHWEFVTGDPGDFETLARRITAIDAPDGIGSVDLDVSDPGVTLLERPAGSMLAFSGPLRPRTASTQPWGDDPAALALTELVDGATGLVVGPPLYGGKAVAVTAVPTGAAPRPLWLRELNVDPRHRGAAALGARLVMEHQEELMKAAWQQAGAIEEANRRLRAARMARRAGRTIVEGRLARLAAPTLLAVSAPALDRLTLRADAIVARSRLDQTRLPTAITQPAFRRLTRPGGRLGRVIGGPAAAGEIATAIDVGRAEPDRSLLGPPSGLITIEGLLAAATGGRRTRAAGPRAGARDKLPDGAKLPTAASLRTMRGAVERPKTVSKLDGVVEIDLPEGRFDLTDAVRDGLGTILTEPDPPPTVAPPAAALATLRGELMASLDPRRTVPAALAIEVRVDAALQGDDPLDEVLATPDLPAPLAVELAELSGDLLLPGADRAPDDSVFGLVTNAAYVQALLVGANHEFARELRWRGFPTDERGTAMRYFWDARGTTDDPAGPPPDIRRIHEFPAAGRLGDAVGGGRREVVLVLRAQLLRRYPGTQLIAVPGEAVAGGGRRPRYDAPVLPRFRGRIGRDILYFGFPFDDVQAAGSGSDPGFYAVFQQPPGAPRFGLDEVDPTVDPAAWPARFADLTWAHVLPPAATDGYVDLAGPAVAFSGEPAVRWGESASGQARITWQQPVRIAIHFSDLLGGGAV